MKLSIITINLNNKIGLLRTLASVESQEDYNFEHVIVDGSSTDGSVEVIKEYASRHDNVLWISEPDTGIYNAMNKAARLASSDYIIYINSGDELYSSDVVQKFNELESDSDIFLGETLLLDANSNIQGRVSYKLCAPALSCLVILKGIAHQSTFIKRALQLTTPYDESLRIAADFKFFLLKLIFENCRTTLVDFCVSKFYLGGVSSTNALKFERELIIKELIPERIILDYKGLTIEGIQLLKRLSKYTGFRSFVLSLANCLVSCYSACQYIVKHISRR